MSNVTKSPIDPERYMVDLTVTDTLKEVEHDGGSEPATVGTGRFYYNDEDDCLCDAVEAAIEHYESHHLDESDGDDE